MINGPDGKPIQLLDGRNRLDAMELVGLEFVIENVTMLGVLREAHVSTPMSTPSSSNLHRRHLTAEQA